MRLLDHIPISARNGSSYDCLVLEIVGSDLFGLLKSNGGLPYAHAKRASAQVASGLAYMHDSRICHGGQSFLVSFLVSLTRHCRIAYADKYL
jgi:serine/threonine protein kinase